MGSSLAGMVNEQHGHLEAALEMAQVAEHGGHLGRDVLVDAVQADERIEHEQPRPEPLDGLPQSALVLAEIEAQARAGDDVDLEALEGHLCGKSDPLDSPAHDVGGVLGREQEHGALVRHGETTQAGGAGGDRDCDVEGEEGLAGLGLASDDADGLLGPELFDQPASILGPDFELVGTADGQRAAHRERRADAGREGATGAAAAWGPANSSKYSFSS